jgi:hypothetical protein
MVLNNQNSLADALSIIGRLQRRDFLKSASAAVVMAGLGGIRSAHAAELKSINAAQSNIFLRIAQVVLPVEGSALAPWKADVLLQTLDDALLGTMEPHILAGLKGGLDYFNEGPKAKLGKKFVDLDSAQATKFMDEWGDSTEVPHRALAMGLKKLIQLSYWANPESWAPLGYDGPITKKNGLKSLGNAPLPTK